MKACRPSDSPAPPIQRGTDADHHRDILRDLIDMGHAIAKTVHAEAMRDAETRNDPGTDPERPSAPDHAARFDRIARCIRRTILLAQHLDRPAPNAFARKRILRRCEDQIARAAFISQKHRTQPLDTHALHTEVLEHLESPDLDDDIGTLPIEDIVAEICRDLGLGLDDLPGICPAPRRPPAALALLNARATQASRPKGARATHPVPALIHDG